MKVSIANVGLLFLKIDITNLTFAYSFSAVCNMFFIIFTYP